MPRKPIIRTDQFPYHVTSRSNNKEWFYIPLNEVWEFCLELLDQGETKFGIKVEAFVLMSNHYHLCLYTSNANIDTFMRFFNQNLGRKISRQANRINRIFGAPYKWTVITDQKYFKNVIRYIYQNPLRAGLCSSCEEYHYSDLRMRNPGPEFLSWINQSIGEFDAEKTRKNLRKYQI